MSKLVFLNLDGTIIDHGSNSIPKKTIEAIDKARANGHIVSLATGRPPYLVEKVLGNIHFDAIVTANGRYVVYKDEVLRKAVIDKATVHHFIEEMTENSIDVALLSIDDYYMVKRTNDTWEKFTEYFHLEEPIHKPEKTGYEDTLQMVMFTEDHAKLDLFRSHYPHLEFNISCPYGVDINTVGGMKEVGVDTIREYLNYSIENTIAIGDGYNDISMIEHVGTGVAMGNACQPLKDAATFVTSPVGEEGIYKAFEKLGLI
jgi:hypothetical protein